MPGSSAGPLLEHGSYPVSEKVALSHFREDAVVLQSTRALYLKLLPSWLRVVSEAIDRHDVTLVKHESHLLATLSRLVGALRLASMLDSLRLVSEGGPLATRFNLPQQLHLCRSEIRVVICYFAQDASVQSGIQEAPQSQEMLSDPERDGLPANQQMLPRPVAPQGGGLGGPQAGPHGAPPGGHAMPAAAFPPTADALHQSPKLSMEVPLFSSLPGGCGGIHTVLGVSGALDEQRVEACRSAVVARASMADASVQTTAVATHEPNSHGLLSPTHTNRTATTPGGGRASTGGQIDPQSSARIQPRESTGIRESTGARRSSILPRVDGLPRSTLNFLLEAAEDLHRAGGEVTAYADAEHANDLLTAQEQVSTALQLVRSLLARFG
uniref:Uncharacterized protein n=1 Tax=Haptolina ericina TaxID=156174 RepID=A0A7S3AXZ1_9EUKA